MLLSLTSTPYGIDRTACWKLDGRLASPHSFLWHHFAVWRNNIAIAQAVFDSNSTLTIAHEIGHVLGLFHPDNPRPLTSDVSGGFGANIGWGPPSNLMNSFVEDATSLEQIGGIHGVGQLLDVERYGEFGYGS